LIILIGESETGFTLSYNRYLSCSIIGIGMGLFSRISKKKQAQIDDKIVSYDDAPDWFFDWQVNNKYLEFTEKPR
jgi:hypothetical protein